MSEFKGKTALITGATGLIGSHIVDKLMSYGDVRVIALSRSIEKLKKGFAKYLDMPNFRVIAQDASLPIDNIGKNLDYIFHAASPIAGSIIKEKPVDVIQPNILGTLNVLNFIEKQKIEKGTNAKLIVFSSATVYSNLSDIDIVVSEEETSVADKLDSPNAPYSESKRMTEVIARAYARQKNLDVSIVRFSYVYGYTMFVPNTAFYEFINTALSGNDIILNNAGLPRRDNIYIDDAVEGLLTVAIKGESGEVYNISTNMQEENFAAVDEMALVIANVVNSMKNTDVHVLYKNGQNGEKRLPGIVLSNTKLLKLGWKVNTDLKSGIRNTIIQLIR